VTAKAVTLCIIKIV